MQKIDTYCFADVTVYVADLPQRENVSKREKEREAEKELLKQVVGEDVVLLHNENGKPYLEGKNSRLSISHSRHKLCLAISEKNNVGIDIEEFQPRLEKLKDRFLTAEEIACLPSEENLHLTALALCWSAKEALYKLVGEEAGVMGEKVAVDMRGIGKVVRKETKGFSAKIGNEEFLLEAVEINNEYEIVLACKC